MLGEKKVKDFTFNPKRKGYAIKVPVFSYEKFPEIQKELGPEMKSTGEAIYFIDTLQDEYFQNVYSERNLYLSKWENDAPPHLSDPPIKCDSLFGTEQKEARFSF